MEKLVIATHNQGKLKEIKALLKDLNFQVVSLTDFPDILEIAENGNTFRENALIKAKEACEKTGFWTMADDSGLEVDALNGAPGVYSARFAGEPKSDKRNNNKLIEALKEVPREQRSARFKCVIAICSPSGGEYFAEGLCEGTILNEPRGSGGFGYDPLFYLPQYQKTFSELELEEKNIVSHRGKALLKAKKLLSKVLLGER